MKSMNLIIEDLSHEYNKNRIDIESIYIDYAIEADEAMPEDVEGNTMGDRLKATVEKIIKTLEGILSRLALTITNLITKVAQSDVGFDKNCREAMVKNNPLEGVKLIAYEYNDNALEGELTRLTGVIQKKLSSMKTSLTDLADPETANDMDRNGGDMIHAVLAEMGVSKDTTNVNSYFLQMKDKFRQEKKEMVFTSANGKLYYAKTKKFDEIKQKANQRHSILKSQTNIVKTNLQHTIKLNGINEDVKKRAIKQFQNVSHLYNFYAQCIKMYMQLKIEQVMSYRIVLKKLYRFS